MNLLSVDPGVNFCGAALFNPGGTLVAAKAIRGSGFKNDIAGLRKVAVDLYQWADFTAKRAWIDGRCGLGVSVLAMEWPQVYAGRQRGRKDPNNLLPLAALDGAIATKFFDTSTFALYLPHDWKGSKKANPTARWVLSRLSNEERAQVEDLDAFEAALAIAESENEDVGHYVHNTVDAIGIGLHHLGRLGKRRVIAR